jgi:hypothetical protein
MGNTHSDTISDTSCGGGIQMRKDEAKAIRGVWERIPGSNVWCVRA